jgi:hypothetical protein
LIELSQRLLGAQHLCRDLGISRLQRLTAPTGVFTHFVGELALLGAKSA